MESLILGYFFAVTAEKLGQVGEVQGSSDATTSDSQQLAQLSHLQAAAVSIPYNEKKW